MKNGKEVPRSPHVNPRTILRSPAGKYFPTKDRCNNPGTLVGPSRDLPNSLHKIFVIIFQIQCSSLDAGDKPSTMFPPERLVKLAAEQVSVLNYSNGKI